MGDSQKSRKKNVTFGVRVTKEELERLKNLAAKEELPLSQYVLIKCGVISERQVFYST